MSKLKFLTYCRLTCLGGSERGECACTRPMDCELKLHVDFEHFRDQAKARMFRHLYGRLDGRVHPAIITALVTLNKAEVTTICPICNQDTPFNAELNKMLPHPIEVDGRRVPCPGGQDA